MATSLPESPAVIQATLDRLLTHLRVNRSGALLVAIADDPLTRREVTAQLMRSEDGGLTFLPFRFADDGLSLMDFLRENVPAEAVVVADGLSDLGEASRRQAMIGLNRQRDALAASSRSLVLWAAEPHLAELMRYAGDFWAWQSGQYYFPSPDLLPWLEGRRLLPDDDRVLNRYLAHVRAQHRYLPLPLARRGGPGTRADVALTDIFVPLTLRGPQPEEAARRRATVTADLSLVSPKERDRRDASELEVVQAASFGEVFNRYKRFLLKGQPGCGKTTLLRRAALAFADGSAADAFGWRGPALIPIFLRLRNFGVFLDQHRERFPHPGSEALTAFIEAYFRDEQGLSLTPDFFERRLAEGGCLILLDGLDEVAANRADVARCVEAFILNHAGRNNRFGLSSRPAGYEAVAGDLRRAAPAVAEVNPLDAKGIEQLVCNLVQLIESNPAARARDVADLPRRLLASSALTRLAEIPLFCTTLVLVYKYHGAQLPQRRVEVYQEIVDLLLGFWRAQQQTELFGARELAQEDGTGERFADVSQAVALKKRRLAHLALRMQTERRTDVPGDWARAEPGRYLQARERKDPATAERWSGSFLRNAHEYGGVFVAVEEDTYAFAHQGFREYLAATALINEREFIRLALRHALDDWWEQVILLAGAHPALKESERADLVAELLKAAKAASKPNEQHAYVLKAGGCAVDMAGYLPGPERELVESALLHLMRDSGPGDYPDDKPRLTDPGTLPPKTRLEAGLLLDSLGWTPPDLYDFIPINSPSPIRRSPEWERGPGGEGRFYISKHPVTNLQYQRFLEHPDCADERLWAEELVGFDAEDRPEKDLGAEALEWFSRNGGKERKPRLWDDPRLGATHRLLPVVGVTWYEAAAYCAWLTRHPPEGFTLPPGFIFRLPTERERVAAAGGEADDRYPWQATRDEGTREEVLMRANTRESNLDGTTPVCMYSAGISPAGVMDMAGNVWQWQANLVLAKKVYRALRGGSWYDVPVNARVAERLNDLPNNDWYGIGFRVLASSG